MYNPFLEILVHQYRKFTSEADIENNENFKKDEIYNVSDLFNATNKDLTFKFKKLFWCIKTKASYCITLDNLSKYLPSSCKKIIVKNVYYQWQKLQEFYLIQLLMIKP